MTMIPKNRLKELRLRARLSQQEVGALMGVTNSVVSHHETGVRQISDENIWKYAEIFKVPTYALFFDPVRIKEETIWDDRMTPPTHRETTLSKS